MEILQYISHILHYAISFAIIISIIVFIHEFGHFFVARRCGVKVDEFSIGFGPEICGWNDKHGTRWKISILPLGGFVKMHGDAGEASTPDNEKLDSMSAEERKIAFYYKKLWQKTLIVLAGPFANFVLSIFIFSLIFMIFGKLQLDAPIVNDVVKDGAAAKIGITKNDVIVALDGKDVNNFSEIPEIIKASSHQTMEIKYKRGENVITSQITPQSEDVKDEEGKSVSIKRIGIESFPIAVNENAKSLSFVDAVNEAVTQVYKQCAEMLHGLGQIFAGTQSAKNLGGPVKIMEFSGHSTSKISDAISCEISHGENCGKLARDGIIISLISITFISTMLGLVNLFPIPLLDGGHILFYFIEAVTRRKVAEKVQEWVFRAGFAFLVCLMLYVTYNDLLSIVHKM